MITVSGVIKRIEELKAEIPTITDPLLLESAEAGLAMWKRSLQTAKLLAIRDVYIAEGYLRMMEGEQ